MDSSTTRRCSVPNLKAGTDIFDMRGIDRDRVCMALVRPDQHVAHVRPMDRELTASFDGFMLPVLECRVFDPGRVDPRRPQGASTTGFTPPGHALPR